MRDPAVTQDAPTVDRAERHRAPNSERTGSRVLAPQVGCLPTGTSSEAAAMKDAPAEPTGTTTGPAELPTNPRNGRTAGVDWAKDDHVVAVVDLSLIHISEPTRLLSISYAVFCLKKK